MILELFLVLLLLSFGAIALGYYTGEPHFSYVGLFFLFLLGVVLLSNNVQYETGVTVSTVGTNSTVTYNYTDFAGDNARWFGLFLAFAAGAGMALMFINYKRGKREDD